LELLPTDGRPMSQANPLAALWEARKALYERFSDVRIANDRTITDCVHAIEEALL
jgi:shikimate kinase